MGKSHACAALLQQLISRKQSCGLWKPAQSGQNLCPDGLLRTDSDFCHFYSGAPCFASYTFEEAIAPHLAAQRQGIELSQERFDHDFAKIRTEHQILLCEGAGGVLSPIFRQTCQADFFARYTQNCLLIAKDGIGTINHTLLSIEALHHRNFRIVGFIFGEALSEKHIALDNAERIQELGQVPFWGYAPKLDQKGWNPADPLFEQFCELMIGGFHELA